MNDFFSPPAGPFGFGSNAGGPSVFHPPMQVAPSDARSTLSARVVPLSRTVADFFRYLAQVLHQTVGFEAGGDVRDAEYFTRLIAATRKDDGGLRRLNQLARAYTDEQARYLALVRSLVGLADAFEECSLAYTPLVGSTTRCTTGWEPLREAARALQRRAEEKLSAQGPLTSTHPTFVQTWRAAARSLDDLLHSPEGLRVHRALAEDQGVALEERRTLLDFGRLVASIALDALHNSPGGRALVQDAEDALIQQSPSNLLGFLAGLGSAATNTVGALPGPDAFSIVLIKLVGTWRLVELHSSPRLPSFRNDLVRWVVHAADFTPSEREAFLSAMTRFEVLRAARADWTLPRQQARDLLGGKFQTGWRLTAALSVLNLIQLASALAGPPEGERNPLQGASEITVAGLAAISGTAVTFDRALNAGRTTQELEALGRTRTLFRVVSELTTEYSGAINATFAITAIIGGAFTFVQGREDHEPWTMVIGGLQVASGIALMIPGGQPAGVILGTVATAISVRGAIDDRRGSECRRAYERVLQQVKSTRSAWDEGEGDPSTTFAARLRIVPAVNALEAAMEQCEFPNIQAGGSRELFSDAVYRLRGLGVEIEQAFAMIDVFGLSHDEKWEIARRSQVA
jgi:hypothetical protein